MEGDREELGGVGVKPVGELGGSCSSLIGNRITDQIILLSYCCNKSRFRIVLAKQIFGLLDNQMLESVNLGSEYFIVPEKSQRCYLYNQSSSLITSD